MVKKSNFMLCLFYHHNKKSHLEGKKQFREKTFLKRKTTINNLREVRKDIIFMKQEHRSFILLMGSNYLCPSLTHTHHHVMHYCPVSPQPRSVSLRHRHPGVTWACQFPHLQMETKVPLRIQRRHSLGTNDPTGS